MSLKITLIILSAVIGLSSLEANAAPTAVSSCYAPTVGPEIFDMPNSFATFKGTTTVGPAKPQFNIPKDFENRFIRFSDGAVHYLRELLGAGETAAVFALNAIWAIRLNTQMDFLPGFVQGQQFCKLLKIPTVEIQEIRGNEHEPYLNYYPSEYVVLMRLYPKHFDDQLTREDEGSFKKATALNLYQNWDRLDPVEREAAHQELKEFMVRLAPLETYFDFQPSNVVRTTQGWTFIDPSLLSGEIHFATPTSLTVPFAVPKTTSKEKSSYNWLTNETFNIHGEARKKIGEHIKAILDYRKNHPAEVMSLVAKGKAFLGIE
jgi:hypothetical protein